MIPVMKLSIAAWFLIFATNTYAADAALHTKVKIAVHDIAQKVFQREIIELDFEPMAESAFRELVLEFFLNEQKFEMSEQKTKEIFDQVWLDSQVQSIVTSASCKKEQPHKIDKNNIAKINKKIDPRKKGCVLRSSM